MKKSKKFFIFILSLILILPSISKIEANSNNVHSTDEGLNNRGAANNTNPVVKPAKKQVYNVNYLMKREEEDIIKSVKEKNPKASSVVISNKKVMLYYNDSTTNEFDIMDIIENIPIELPKIFNGNYEIIEKSQATSLYAFRGEQTSFGVNLENEIGKTQNNIPGTNLTKNGKTVLVDNMSITKKRADGKTPDLQATGFPKGVRFNGKVYDKPLDPKFGNGVLPQRKEYRVEGPVAIDANLGKHEIIYTIEKQDDLTQKIHGYMNFTVYPQKEKYKPELNLNGKAAIELTKSNELETKIKGLVKFNHKGDLGTKDLNQVPFKNDKISLPDGAKYEIGNIDENIKDQKQEVTIKVVYKDNQGGDSIDTFTVPVILKSTEAEKYPPTSTEIIKEHGTSTTEDEIKNAINIPNYPKGKDKPTLKVDTTKIPDGNTPGDFEVPVTITYTDGSSTTTKVKVKIGEPKTKDEIIPYNSTDPEPQTGSDGKQIPANYITVIFRSSDITKGTVKVGETFGFEIKAKVKPGTNLVGKVEALAEAGYGFMTWSPSLGVAIDNQEYLANFMKSGQEVGEDAPIPQGWFRVKLTQDNTIKPGTVSDKWYAVEPNGKLPAEIFVELKDIRLLMVIKIQHGM